MLKSTYRTVIPGWKKMQVSYSISRISSRPGGKPSVCLFEEKEKRFHVAITQFRS
jgi:hypothetical protein